MKKNSIEEFTPTIWIYKVERGLMYRDLYSTRIFFGVVEGEFCAQDSDRIFLWIYRMI